MSPTSIVLFRSSSAVAQANTTNPLIWKVNWAMVAMGKYAIADPNDPGELLYLSPREYISFLKTSIANDSTLLIIAHPSDEQPAERDIKAKKPNSPPSEWDNRRLSGWAGLGSRIRRQFFRGLDSQTGLVVPSKRNLGKLLYSWVGALWLWSGLPPFSVTWLQDCNHILRYLRKVLETQGPYGLCLCLKVSLLAVNSFLGGSPLKSTRALGYCVKLTNGLPGWIPVNGRAGIRARSYHVIRFWTSFLTSYKAFRSSYNFVDSVKSITAPPLVLEGESDQLFSEFREFLLTRFVPSLGGIRRIPQGDRFTLGTVTSAGPNGAPAIETLSKDAWALNHGEGRGQGFADPERNTPLPIRENLLSILKYHNLYDEFCDRTTDYDDFPPTGEALFGEFYKHAALGVTRCPKDLRAALLEEWKKTPKSPQEFGISPSKLIRQDKDFKGGILSRISFIPEACGKLRVVAILDGFSQLALRPLHDDLFSVLKGIPQDGTHSQEGLFSYLKGISSLAQVGGKGWWKKPSTAFPTYWSSLDISKATDMIPKELYQILLSSLYGSDDYARSILGLMTDREYKVDKNSIVLKKSKQRKLLPDFVRYTRGQPMGALGSFALLGLWHHAWIQFAAHRIGLDIKTYGVTGDDLVLCESDSTRPVSKSYLHQCSVFGIPISLPKSYLSPYFFNFLNRLVVNGVEVSPASLREELQVKDLTSRLSRTVRLLTRGFGNLEDDTKWLATAMKLMFLPEEFRVHVTVHKGSWSHNLAKKLLSVLLGPNFSYLEKLRFKALPLRAWFGVNTGDQTLRHRYATLREGAFSPSSMGDDVYREFLISMGKILVDEIKTNLRDAVTRLEAVQPWLARQGKAVNEGWYVHTVAKWFFAFWKVLLAPEVKALMDPVEDVRKRLSEMTIPQAEEFVTSLVFQLEALPQIPDYRDIEMFSTVREERRYAFEKRVPILARRLMTITALAQSLSNSQSAKPDDGASKTQKDHPSMP
jgi:hypothetical protein